MDNSYLAGEKRIADRFTLDSLSLEEFSAFGTTTWMATDMVLSRRLRAIVVDPELAQRPQVIDAARRAALLNPAHHIAVLAVHDEESSAVIFTEIPAGKRLKSYLERGPLDPASVAAIMGQIATGIHDAQNFGIRDLQLQARSIYLQDSGEVIIDGIGIRGALAQVDLRRDPITLDRAEARGLVIFLAALLQGKDFPLDPATHDAVLQAALALPNLPAPIAHILEAETNWQGPISVGDFLRMLAPWGDIDFSALPDPHASLHTAFPLLHSRETVETRETKSIVAETTTDLEEIKDEEDEDKNGNLKTALSWPKLNKEEIPNNEVAVPNSAEIDTSLASQTSYVSLSSLSKHYSLEPQPEDSETTPSQKLGSPTSTNSPRISRRPLIALLLALFLITGVGLFAIFNPFNDETKTSSNTEKTTEQKTSPDLKDLPTPEISAAKVITENPQTLESDSATIKRLVEDVKLAIDGNLNTAWYTWWYQNASVYNNDKVGVLVKLKEKTAISEITVTVRGKGGTIKWMSSPSSDSQEGKLIASNSIEEKTVLKAEKPIMADEFVLWIDSLPVDGEGKNRAVIAEIEVK